MRSSLRVQGSLALLLGLAVVMAPDTATAQSLFDALFGEPKPVKRQPPYPNANRLLPPAGMNYGQPYATPPRYGDDDEHGSAQSPGGRYGGQRAVCVRMCDGYYWPVSYSAPRSQLYRDADTCASSCSSEAKLFHYPTNGGRIEDAVDLTGRVYSRLPTAFKYRKTLVQGCSCKPEPWSDAEIERHRGYALGEEAAAGGKRPVSGTAEIPVPPPSGSQESVTVGDATEAGADTIQLEFMPEELAPARGDVDALPVGRARKALRTQAADHSQPLARGHHRSTTSQPPARARQQAGAKASGGFWGGPQQYTWPGDAPVRMR
jgi:hypothetical protein